MFVERGIKAFLVIGAFFVAASGFDVANAKTTESKSATSTSPAPKVVYTVVYAGGPEWVQGLPPEKQNLDGHFQFIDEQFRKNNLVANGPFGDEPKGFYVFNEPNPDALMQLLRQDPGLRNGTLTIDSVAKWVVLFDQLGNSGTKFFILNYRPGPNWNSEKALSEQDLTHHQNFIGSQVKKGKILAGGPVNDFQGRYVLTVENLEAATQFTNEDPGITSGIFRAEIKPWNPIHRQAISHKP